MREFAARLRLPGNSSDNDGGSRDDSVTIFGIRFSRRQVLILAAAVGIPLAILLLVLLTVVYIAIARGL